MRSVGFELAERDAGPGEGVLLGGSLWDEDDLTSCALERSGEGEARDRGRKGILRDEATPAEGWRRRESGTGDAEYPLSLACIAQNESKCEHSEGTR